jgi:hypothetical protein
MLKSSSKKYRSEGYLATVQIKPVIFTMLRCTSCTHLPSCFSPAELLPSFFAAGAGNAITLNDASAPPQSHGQQLELAEGTSPRGLPCYCTDKAANTYSAPQHIRRVALLSPRHRRGAAGNGLETTIMNLRRKTSGAAGQGLGTTIKYLRGAAGIGLGTTIKYLRRTTSPV